MKRMKNRKKTILLAVTIALVLAASVGGTIAWITTSTPGIENVFKPVEVNTWLVEEDWVDEGSSKPSIQVQNASDPTKYIPVYVRVAVSGNWVLKGEIVAPWTGTPVINDDDWFEKDGFYYYRKVLPVDAVDGITSNLLDTNHPIQPEKPETVPADAHLEVDVLHQSIQANPTTVVEGLWPVDASDDGQTISPKN